MESFNSYFNRIYNIVPEEYKYFGNFGIGTYQDVFEEGLTHSYDINKLINMLEKLPEYKEIYNKEFDSLSLVVDVSDKDIENYVKELNKTMYVYGYMVAKVNGRLSGNGISLTIEQKHPDIIDPSTYNEGPYYHITHEKYVDKILEKGLSPRSSQTMFNHAGGRIYLIQCLNNNDWVVNALADKLFKNKQQQYLTKATKTTKSEDWKRFQDFSTGKMVKFLVDVSGIKISYDPMVPRREDTYRAGFTGDYISPNKLKLV